MENRIIKFRGLRKDNGKWIYGLLVRKNKRASAIHYITIGKRIESEFYIQTRDIECNVDVLKEFKVIPESVGQFTGLTDKDGEEIYEGDIIDSFSGKYEVSFRDGCFTGIDEGEHYPLFDYVTEFIEVIGNVTENLEMLNGN